MKCPTFFQINIFSKLENYPKVLQKKISLKYKLSTHFEKSNKKSKQSRHFRKIFCWLTIQMPWLLLLLTPFHMLICSSNLFLEAFRSCWVGVRVFSKVCCQKKNDKTASKSLHLNIQKIWVQYLCGPDESQLVQKPVMIRESEIFNTQSRPVSLRRLVTIIPILLHSFNAYWDEK